MHTERLQLRLLGSIDLTRTDGTQVQAVLSQPKRLALLIYLAAALPRGFHRRDTLLALFWPETPQLRARRDLNRAIYYLRQSLGHGVLVSRGHEELAVDTEWLWCDVGAFEQALDAHCAEDGLELYRGDVAPFGCGNADWTPDGASFVCWAGGGRLARVSREGEVLSYFDPSTAGLQTFTGRHRLSPDGSRVYIRAIQEDGSEGIWWFPITGGKATKVVALDDPSLTTGAITVGPEHLYLTIAKFESDIWVMDLEYQGVTGPQARGRANGSRPTPGD